MLNPEDEKRIGAARELVIPEIEPGEPGDYSLVSSDSVAQILGEEFHYGPSKRYVDAIYVHKELPQAVGVLRVTDELCEGHFVGNPIMRGVDQAEAIAQTLLLLGKLKGNISDGQSPRLSVIDMKYANPAVPGMVLNIVVSKGDKPMSGFGRIYNGARLISEGRIGGDVMDSELSQRLLDRARRQIQAPNFPLP